MRPKAARPRTTFGDHVLQASAAGRATSRALVDRLAQIARDWPPGQTLRILQLGARRGVLSCQMLRRLHAERGAFMFQALTDPADQPALATALAEFPQAEGGGLAPWRPTGRKPAHSTS